jgi:Collagen triple helix repeat (20 copies)
MAIRKFEAGRVITLDLDHYVGTAGTIFYDEATAEMRLSDGVTPGGIPINMGGGGGGGTGPRGPSGPSGASGAIGPSGAQGNPGASGPSGTPGASGPSGAQGNPGASGPSGPSGTPGASGPSGAQGLQGNPGASGPSGPSGAQGLQGNPGVSGPSGPSGAASTVSGPSGPSGARGPSGAGAALNVNIVDSNNTVTGIITNINTLTFQAGTGITISSNTASQTITINSVATSANNVIKTFNILNTFYAPLPGTSVFIPTYNDTIRAIQMVNGSVVTANLIVSLYKNGFLLDTWTLPAGQFYQEYSGFSYPITVNDQLTVNVVSGSGINFAMTLLNSY